MKKYLTYLLLAALGGCTSVKVVEYREQPPAHPVQVINPYTQGGHPVFTRALISTCQGQRQSGSACVYP